MALREVFENVSERDLHAAILVTRLVRYGRFTKSIKPEECGESSIRFTGKHDYFTDLTVIVCGACQEGTLIPLFTVRTRAPRTPKANVASAMAAENGRDSPCSVIRVYDSPPGTPTPCSRISDRDTFTSESDTVDMEMAEVINSMETVGI
ncbi:hypothetical protein OE88DRAFT_161838 [Heliocybe sulcata]|uniref:Uncharacterized protein n=1 Tax=Heliocybe sulcata TaxID=5364 RepID=A0A5C3NVC5_9AGAM|nr:hypothetical protein OE88DRAFT_161838 [Heliocybe sulcata]